MAAAETESVKGFMVLGAVVQARRMRDRGELPVEAIETRLSGPAQELVDAKVEISRWYPIAPFCELLNLAWDLCGGRDPAYMEEQGERSVERMLASGLYLQLDYAQRAGKVENRSRLKSQAKMITSITSSFYSFLEYDVKIDADRLEIHYHNARAFEDVLVHTSVGFMNEINRRQGSKRRFRGERVAPEHVRFTMDLPERLAAAD